MPRANDWETKSPVGNDVTNVCGSRNTSRLKPGRGRFAARSALAFLLPRVESLGDTCFSEQPLR